MKIELSEDAIATIVKAMHTALQHEKEAIATGEVDMCEVGKIESVLQRITAQVINALHAQVDTSLAAMGFKK